ncbi:lanthionine synthetase C family protein [Actinocorallia libanotica]|uniref:Lanthionine synthetase C family protein n=1 Tax=Actinocorallia libanotica TaxID=46162 RepID=A0ABP4BW81_9ACTN
MTTDPRTSITVEAAVQHCLARLPDPGPAPQDDPWIAHSLTRGAAGIAICHIVRAHHGETSWQAVHAWITQACAGPVSASPNTGLFQGLPAIAFVLHTTGRYRHGLADTLPAFTYLAHRRAADVHDRIEAGALGTFREYDVFFGLAGLGSLLLRLDPDGAALEAVLTALVALTRPLHIDGEWLPGWWTSHDPHRRVSPKFPGGHANFGFAHGVTAILGALAISARSGRIVDHHHDAMATILDHLASWRQDGPDGPWWPQWISRADHAAGRPTQTGPGRPSWCYGTPGIARAGQLAGLALGDAVIQRAYEDAFAACLTDPAQQNHITEPGLCHGAAGLYQTAWRAAHDATTPAISHHLPGLANRLVRLAAHPHAQGPGFLDGDAGTLAALYTLLQAQSAGRPPDPGWDACLLLT